MSLWWSEFSGNSFVLYWPARRPAPDYSYSPPQLVGGGYSGKPEIGPEKSYLVNFVACYVRF